ncbi:hypothetical protein [uncultured Rothia sp.]|uniref:hypothetical protein n=1 Tax=uncultured Rothia sp. TaxID=316088 RepID=UPI003217D3ED
MSDQNDYGQIPSSDNNNYGNLNGTNAGSHASAPHNSGAQNPGFQNPGAQSSYAGNYGQPNGTQNSNGSPVPNQPPSYAGAMGYSNGAEPEKPATPKTLKIASYFIYGTILLGIIATILQLSNPDALMQQAGITEEDLSGSGLSSEDMESFTRMIMWAGAIWAVIQYALTIMFTVFMLRGANWARIVLTILMVFGAFGILSLPLAALLDVPMGIAALSTISGLLCIGAIVYMFLRPSNEFFRKMRERKQWLAFNQYR